jgi:hypothetical protein
MLSMIVAGKKVLDLAYSWNLPACVYMGNWLSLFFFFFLSHSLAQADLKFKVLLP